jgi:hypothetical protein
MRSSVFPKALVLGLCLALFFAAPSFAQSGGQKPPENGYGKGQPFSAISDAYQLSGVLKAPEYDTDSGNGFAVVFLKKEATVPKFFRQAEVLTSEIRKDTSQVDFSLDDGAARIESTHLTFILNEDGDKDYAAKFIAFFTWPKGKEFPKKGVFLEKRANDSDLEYPVDLSGVEITGTL